MSQSYETLCHFKFSVNGTLKHFSFECSFISDIIKKKGKKCQILHLIFKKFFFLKKKNACSNGFVTSKVKSCV